MIDAKPSKAQLLVSVRTADEALLALAGGAALIDIKEPALGSLGRADLRVIREIVAAIDGRRPVSAALGEWTDDGAAIPDADLSYVKWGLAGCGRDTTWRRAFARLLNDQRRPQPVLVAYADWECAQAPPIDEVFALAAEYAGSVLLVDTHCKEAGVGRKRPTLLDWLPVTWIEDLCARAREQGVQIALAGSLGLEEIRTLRFARPDWFAVRGAVCDDGDRQAGVQIEKIRQLVALLNNLALTPDPASAD